MYNKSISIAKGIGILLMVLGHSGIKMEYINNFIYQFHMPLFFFISGYCFKNQYLIEWSSFTLKRINRLYLPFIKWLIVFILLHNVFCDIGLYEANITSYNWEDMMVKIINVLTGMHVTEQLLGGYWFIKQLLFASFISLIAIKYIKNNKIVIAILLTITILLSAVNWYIPYIGVTAQSFLSASFFVAGFEMKNYFKILTSATVALICFILVAITAWLLPTNMGNFTAIVVIPFFISAIAGTIMVMYISGHIQQWGRLLEISGDFSMEILTFHFLCFKIVSFFIIQFYSMPMDSLGEFPVIHNLQSDQWWILYFIMGAGLPLICYRIYNLVKVKMQQ